ncbi:cell envelope biogenesis protein OmpA [Streptomyces umbrinus]|uniref:cell envelope biogenesis protein OmpA n=1 Tax=Streptomyces umbrinus TaxID=67370 RepID=UPI0033FF7980
MTALIPVRCIGRPLAGGLVVPWVSLIHNGHAVFGSLDADRARRAFLQRLCQICSQPLQERSFFIVRPADQQQGYSPEPALHPECQPYTAANCPMLNGTATHYRTRHVLASHPAGRPCTDPSCPCPELTPDEGHAARSGRPADRYEAWMIHTRNYRLVFPPDRPEVPSGISLDVPVLRQRVLRTATLTSEQQHLMDLWHALMNGS